MERVLERDRCGGTWGGAGSRASKASERGVVLMVVLVVVAILATLVVDMIYFTGLDVEISHNARQRLRAYYLAKSGVNLVRAVLEKGSLEELSQYVSAPAGDGVEGAWSIKIPFFPIGDAGVAIDVVDERSKINLNALVNQRTNAVDYQVYTQIVELSRLLGVDAVKAETFASSLVNWLDRPIEGSRNDQDPRGATGSYYRSLSPPYSIKDGPLDSVAEIRLVSGMDDEYYDKIKGFVTVYPGDKKVNFSTATKPVMMAVLKSAKVSAVGGQESAQSSELKDDVAEAVAQAVIDERAKNAVVTAVRVVEIVNEVDPTALISSGVMGTVLGSGKSDCFTVRAGGIAAEGEAAMSGVEAVIVKEGSGENTTTRVVAWKER